MNDDQLTTQIKLLITQISSFDKSRLYPEGPQAVPWNNYSREGLKRIVDAIFTLIISFGQIGDVNLCGFTILNNIYSHLTAFVSAYASVTGLVDAQITSQHHQALNYLNTLNDYIRSSGMYTELKFDPNENVSKISAALEFGNLLLANKIAFEQTSEIFKEVLGDKEKFTQNLLLDKGKLCRVPISLHTSL